MDYFLSCHFDLILVISRPTSTSPQNLSQIPIIPVNQSKHFHFTQETSCEIFTTLFPNLSSLTSHLLRRWTPASWNIHYLFALYLFSLTLECLLCACGHFSVSRHSYSLVFSVTQPLMQPTPITRLVTLFTMLFLDCVHCPLMYLLGGTLLKHY